jgi:hypothetical protein
LTTGDISERAFTEECVRDARLTRLRDKVSVEPVTTLSHPYTSEVEVVLANGAVLRGAGDASKSATPAELDKQWARLVAKFNSLAISVVGEARAARIIDCVAGLDASPDVREIIALATH